MAKIIGISGISGAGTTTITKALGKFYNASTIFWDDFDDISESPDDYVLWFNTSKNYADWRYPALEKSLSALRNGRSIEHPTLKQKIEETPLIFFDAPLGKKHEATAQHVDIFIHLDTSMDVALARRLIRDFSTEESAQSILDILRWYLKEGRPLFDASAIQERSDVVIDGNLSVDEIVQQIQKFLK